MDLQEFNALSVAEAERAVKPCLDVPRWINDVVSARPYPDVPAVISRAEEAGAQLTTEEVDLALAHHPRIGDRADGASTEAELSRGEQAGLGDLEDDIKSKLARGNAEYEERFDQVFLIRAAGRSQEEILSELQRRMTNSSEQEAVEVADQLGQIATLRLEGLLS